VRANYGRGGAHTAWLPALTNILNVQSNSYLNGAELLVLGHLDFEDLMVRAENATIEQLREIVQEIDYRVTMAVMRITKTGKVPIIIGGGHNNAYGNIKGAAMGLHSAGRIKQETINCINCDAHADFRPMEGRHSGNGFSYAFSEHKLGNYAIVGLHENYNSESVLQELKRNEARIQYSLFEDIFIREETGFRQAVQQAINFTTDNYCGIELDMDTVQNMPASARTSSGISANQARQYVSWCGRFANAAYLHIAEAAPVLAHLKADIKTGKLIAYLVTDFIKAHNTRG